ncbi:MAG: hypothetical protein MUF21_15380 [Gemmatimonadaceae bacterium]|jgi:hypothetical protein|nr:hypothetical protein [Gemmatimonadaceae bacterium]
MHRIWLGLDPKIVMGCLGGAVSIIVLVIHAFAFNVVGYPKSTMAKYSSAPAAASAR